MDNYLLVICLNYLIAPAKSELHIPFNAEDRATAVDKASDVCNIWKNKVVSAKLYELYEIEEFEPTY